MGHQGINTWQVLCIESPNHTLRKHYEQVNELNKEILGYQLGMKMVFNTKKGKAFDGASLIKTEQIREIAYFAASRMCFGNNCSWVAYTRKLTRNSEGGGQRGPPLLLCCIAAAPPPHTPPKHN